jgi:hypothetical protein
MKQKIALKDKKERKCINGKCNNISSKGKAIPVTGRGVP